MQSPIPRPHPTAMLKARAALGLLLAVPSVALAEPAKPITAADVVKAAPASAWTAIDPHDLLVMTLAPDTKGQPRQIIIQLIPAPLAQGWVANVRKLAAAHWWDGLSVYRVQDNWVAQWGDGDNEDKAKAKALPEGLAKVPESDYDSLALQDRLIRDPARGYLYGPGLVAQEDPYALTQFWQGWPIGRSAPVPTPKAPVHTWPVHCYASVGVARDLSPDTGSGAELYAVIGQPPRQLDRNIAVVGRVIEGIAHLSVLPRAPGNGVYKDAADRTAILSVRLASDLPADQQPHFEYLSTAAPDFARYADLRTHRHDDFIKVPAAGADICSIPVPIRRHPAS